MSKGFLTHTSLSKIFNTLFEENIGMFYKRNYNITNNSKIVIGDFQIGTIENILKSDFLLTKMDAIYENKKSNTYSFVIDNFSIIFKDKIKKGEDDNYNNNTIVIYYNGKKSDNPNYFLAETIMFNLTKHKYVPDIEIIDPNEIDIEINKIAKIKINDPLIKFYGFNKNSICKITYKSNKINNINLYFNYRLII